jgi:hypothetical protein
MAQEITINIGPRGDLSGALAELPKEFGEYLNAGFRALSTLPIERYTELTTFVTEHAPRGGIRPSTRTALATNFGIGEEDAGPLIAAITFAVSVVLENRDLDSAPERFTAAALENNLIDENSKSPVLALTKIIISQRSALSKGVERVQLGTRLLPSLATFSSLVDIRPKFFCNRHCFCYSGRTALFRDRHARSNLVADHKTRAGNPHQRS